MGFRAWGQANLPGGGPGDPEKNRFLGGSGPKRHRGARVGARRPGFLSRDVAGATFEGGTGKGPGAVAGSARGRPSVKTAESGRDGPRQGPDRPGFGKRGRARALQNPDTKTADFSKRPLPSSSSSRRLIHILITYICCLSVLEGYKVWGKCCGGGTCGPDRD